MIKIEKTPYLSALNENKGLRDVIINCVEGRVQFKYGNVSRHKFDTTYSAKGWLGRKIIALPLAVWSGIAKVVYHLAKLIFIGIPKTFADRGLYLKLQTFYIVRDFQESYGWLTSFFNDKYGQFPVQESQFQKACYDHISFSKKSNLNGSSQAENNHSSNLSSSTRAKKNDSENKSSDIQKKFETQLYKKVDKKFIGKISDCNSYSSLEKDMLSRIAKNVYCHQKGDKEGQIIGPTDWVKDTTTIDYLNWFAFKQPNFSTISGFINQFEVNSLGEVLTSLPPKIDMGPRVYGHALQVSGNHRTGFVIDMDNQTVEYFNSFGQDTTAKGPLTALATALTQKYGVNFKYNHRTENSRLQTDGYQCGIWTCKMIIEYFKKRKNFNPASLLDFNIAHYRNKVYAKVHKLHFFLEVGKSRYETYLRKSTDEVGSEEEILNKAEELRNKVYALLDKKFTTSGADDRYIERATNNFIDSIYIEWGRRLPIPTLIRDLVQQAKSHN